MTPPGEASPDNGRVTLALLGQKIDQLNDNLSKFCDQAEPRIREIERVEAVHEQRLDTTESEVSTLRKVSNVWSGINSLGALLAGLWGGSR